MTQLGFHVINGKSRLKKYTLNHNKVGGSSSHLALGST